MGTRWLETMSNDPWSDMAPAVASNSLNARRVDALLQWGFYWARDIDNRCMLLLKHATSSTPTTRLPHLKEIEVTLAPAEPDDTRLLVLRLIDPRQRDLFCQLCLDIVQASASAKSEAEAVALSVGRTWRWHHLLRGGGDGLLSPEEQKGLIGELLVLEKLLALFPPADTLTAWRGPLGAPKDFEVGSVWIEAKARRGAATPHVAITSEFQLDADGADGLFLHVVDLEQAPSGATSQFTLSDIALRVRTAIEGVDQLAADRLESLLAAAGFGFGDDYSEFAWVMGKHRTYQVRESFPSITPRSFVNGVLNVQYAISLPACEPFAVSDDVMMAALRGGSRGN